VAREGWGRIPHYALGGSSGGAFVIFLAQSVPLDGAIPVIAAVPPVALEARPRAADSSKTWPFPPTFFVHMERDEATAQGVAANLAALKKQVGGEAKFRRLWYWPGVGGGCFTNLEG